MTQLTQEEKDTYEWQIWVPGFGEAGQKKLKETTVLISRVGGLGSVVAYELAAAGVGSMVLAHGGNIKPSDLNRQLLMTHSGLGSPRVDSAKNRLLDLNPRLNIETYAENVTEDNAAELVAKADIIVDCAPLFEERYLLNREAVRQNKVLVECAMFELEAQITTIVPGQTPCLRCIYPDKPKHWKREFSVFGAVSGTVGCMGAMEVIKWASGLGELLKGRLHSFDLRDMSFMEQKIRRDKNCPICSGLSHSSS